jgi:hypothetical protein
MEDMQALIAAIEKLIAGQSHQQQGQAMQRVIVMGKDETGENVPLPVAEGALQTSSLDGYTVKLTDISQKLGAVKCSSASNTLFTADQRYAHVQVVLTTVPGVTNSTTGVVVYHRPLGAAKADSQAIFNGTIQAGMNVVITGLGLANTDVLTVDAGTVDRIVASVYGVARA